MYHFVFSGFIVHCLGLNTYITVAAIIGQSYTFVYLI